MNTQKPNIKNEILSETAVFDYVAGHMNEEYRAIFEEKLARDPNLQRQVNEERLLREQLVKVEHSDNSADPISDRGIDKLFDKIDELEAKPSTATEIASVTRLSSTKNGWKTNRWFGATAIAASAILAVVLLVNNPTDKTAPTYDLLSDKSQAKQIEFNNLVADKKVAQIWLPKEIASEQVSVIFREHKLTPVGRAGLAWVVTAEQSLSQEKVEFLNAIDEFEKVKLISYETQQ